MPQFTELQHQVMIAVQHRRAEQALLEREQELKESEERYRALFEHSSEGILVTDVESRKFLYANPAISTLLGYSHDEIVSLGVNDIHPQEQLPWVLEEFGALVGGEKDRATKIPVLTRDKQTRFVDIGVSELTFGRKRLFAGYFTDITEQKQAEDALRESEVRLSSIINIAPVGIGTSVNRVIQTFNEQFCQITGYNAAEIVGHSARMVYPTQEEYDFVGRELFEKKQGRGSVETRWKKKDGTTINVIFSTTPLDPSDLAKGVIFTAQDITERKQSEQASKESEADLVEAQRVAQIGSWRFDIPGNIITWSDELFRIFEIEKTAFGGEYDCFLRQVHPDDKPRVLEINRKAREGEGPFELEYRIVTREGRVKYIREVGYSTKNAQGKVVGLFGTAQDITERKRAEEEIRSSHELLRLTLKAAHAGTWDWDMSSGTLNWSPEFYELFGLPPGMPPTFETFLSVVHPDDRETTMAVILESVKLKKPLWNEYRILHPGRKELWIAAIGDTVYSDSGTPLRMSGVCVDISPRKMAEADLRKSEERFRLLASNTTDVIWTLDLAGRFTYVSPSVEERLLGYTADEFVHQEFGTSLTPASAEIARDRFARFLEEIHEGKPPSEFRGELEEVRKDGSTIWTEIVSKGLFNEQNELIGIIGVSRDITDRKRIEDALRKANRQLNLLTSITRHDIKNKVMVVLGHVGIAEKVTTDPKLAHSLEKIRSSTEAIRSQIEFTKIYEDLGSHEPAWQSLDTVLHREQVPPSISLNPIVAGVEVFADPMLEKVFYNLLDNSIQHGDHVTEIRVSSQLGDQGLKIVWEDNGIGIPLEQKEKIFERGYGKNSGLGLFLVREILALTGITIKENGEPGKGARFEILVPKGMYRIRT